MTLLTRQLQVSHANLYWGMGRKWIQSFGEKTSGGLLRTVKLVFAFSKL